jgi:hypothetical protein
VAHTAIRTLNLSGSWQSDRRKLQQVDLPRDTCALSELAHSDRIQHGDP